MFVGKKRRLNEHIWVLLQFKITPDQVKAGRGQ